jgi:bifunctional non-homologous end joining protein LigD
MQQVSLYYRAGSSDKEYHVKLEPIGDKFKVNFAYGRKGSTLNTGSKTSSPVDYEEASKILTKLVKEKKAKGYTEGESGTPYQHTDKQSSGIECQLLNPICEEEVSRLIADDDWCMQEKFDGRRILVRKEGAAIHGINRKGLLVGLPSIIVNQAQKIASDIVIDGECVGDVLYAFDLLHLGEHSRMHLPYEERLNQLTDVLDAESFQNIQLVETAYQSSEKFKLMQQLKADRKEGVVLKQLSAPYTAGRPNTGGSQLKHKFYATASVVVTKINRQRSVEVSVLNGAGWKGAGNVTIPANHSIPKTGTVVEVRYLYIFKESGCLYQPTYLGIRSDIGIEECVCGQLKFKAGAEDEY